MSKKINKSIFVKELIQAFSRIGITGHGTKKYIADLCGVSSTAVGKWTRVDSNVLPQLEYLFKISEETGTSLDRLIKGEEETIESIKIPILPLEYFSEHQNLDYSLSQKTYNYIPAMNNIKKGFAIVMGDDSMSYDRVQQPNYPDGTLLVFNSEKPSPNNNDYVFASAFVQGERTGIFRKFIKVGGKSYLSPLNPMYDKEEEDFKVLGILSYSINYVP